MPLEIAIQSRGFTPARRDLPELGRLLAAERGVADLAVSAMIRAEGARAWAEGAFADAAGPSRARLLDVVGTTGGPEVLPLLLAALDDEDPKTRRVAIGHLGKMQDTRIEPALLAALDRALPPNAPEDVRALVAALGKVGGEASRARLAALPRSEDPAWVRVHTRAVLALGRTLDRDESDAFAVEAALDAPVRVVLHCRSGLEGLVAEEIGAPGVGVRRARVEIDEARGVTGLVRSRLALSLGFPLPVASGLAVTAEAVAEALTSAHARAVFSAFTRGTPRFRVSWADGGHKRALVWKIAELVHEATRGWPTPLVNDPTGSVWDVLVEQGRAGLAIELSPRKALGERFAYRVRDVPAASHPTIAAALARLAEVRADDVVWDPFVGSGTELVERALLGPAARLIGTDLEEDALRAARENTDAAGLDNVELWQGDALTTDPGPVSLVITNPPLGRRLRRDAGLRGTLTELFVRAGQLLVPGGRLVWISPHPESARAAAADAGLALTRAFQVDMGGFECAMERWDKPSK